MSKEISFSGLFQGGFLVLTIFVLSQNFVDFIFPYLTGQIELYTHIPVMKQLVEVLQKWNFNVCSVYLLDSQFLIESSKFISGVLTALSTMVNLETPHVNVMTKLDLLSKKDKKELDRYAVVNTRRAVVET